MKLQDIHVTVDQPVDLVGSVLVPVAAILISSLIAVGLAWAQSRRTRKDQKREITGRLSAALLQIQVATDIAEIDRIWATAIATSNVLELYAGRHDHFFLRMFWVAARDTADNATPDERIARLRGLAPEMIGLLAAQTNGRITEAGLRRTLPPATVAEIDAWSTDFDAKRWPGF